jgi:hypothetical protein
MLFSMKSNPSIKDGAKHLWRAISLSRYLQKEDGDDFDTVIQSNWQYGHPDNIILFMCDE